jgi:hypothetical protein
MKVKYLFYFKGTGKPLILTDNCEDFNRREEMNRISQLLVGNKIVSFSTSTDTILCNPCSIDCVVINLPEGESPLEPLNVKPLMVEDNDEQHDSISVSDEVLVVDKFEISKIKNNKPDLPDGWDEKVNKLTQAINNIEGKV